jgi:DNA-binding beta-propeller fold protein YncE
MRQTAVIGTTKRWMLLLAVLGLVAIPFLGFSASTIDSQSFFNRYLKRANGSGAAEPAKKTLALHLKTANAPAGLLYVLDSNDGRQTSQVLVVDPELGSIVRTFESGYNPDFALSPDGSRLFILSTDYSNEKTPHSLSILNAETGDTIKKVTVNDRWLYNVIPPASSLTVSADGRFLYVFMYNAGSSPENTFYWISTLDIDSGVFLPETVALNRCEVAQILTQDPGQLPVICAETNDVRLLKMTTRGAAAVSTVKLPTAGGYLDKGAPRQDRVVYGFLSEGKLITVMRDGRVLKADCKTRQVLKLGGPDLPVNKKVSSVAASSKSVYLGVGANSLHGSWTSDEIVVLDKQTFAPRGTISLSRPFNSLAMSADNKRLYAIDTYGATLMVIDTDAAREIKSIEHVGTTPSLILPSP